MWLGFVAPISLASILLGLVFFYCGARARKYPAILFAIGFATALAGVAVWWLTENLAQNLIFICSKISPHENCSVVKDVGDLTTKFIEIGFAALGAGIMALAIDIRSRNALDEKYRNLFDEYPSIEDRELQWRQYFDKFGEELDSFERVPRMEHYLALKRELANILMDKSELRRELRKWDADFSNKSKTQ